MPESPTAGTTTESSVAENVGNARGIGFRLKIKSTGAQRFVDLVRLRFEIVSGTALAGLRGRYPRLAPNGTDFRLKREGEAPA